jgi:hypothetical protein
MRTLPLVALAFCSACTFPRYDNVEPQGSRELLVLERDLCAGTFGCGSYRIRAGVYEMSGSDAKAEYFWPNRRGGGGVQAGALIDTPKAIRVPRDRSKICVVTVFNLPNCAPWPADAERRSESIVRPER